MDVSVVVTAAAIQGVATAGFDEEFPGKHWAEDQAAALTLMGFPLEGTTGDLFSWGPIPPQGLPSLASCASLGEFDPF